MDQHGIPRTPQTYFLHIDGVKYHLQTLFVMLVKVKLQFTMYDVVKLELMVPCRFDSIKIYIGVFVMIWTNMAFQEPHKTYFLHFDGVKYHLQPLFVMLVKVKLQFTMYDAVKLELMVPCRFDSIKFYIGVFVMIWTKMAFQEPHKTYFLPY